ncbi:Binding-protein-dependent transport systems inner membrane component [uncultured spirochete]|uniref:Binding-protein-dependent transport systems inner membrane component n=1 Tax=uncultured spirochete TaxID=156406 RepID=A0A3P3XRU2_9SPIR|nr:Binding-protein-dependent transport systems inner membrane component [uncultured spirochete]
MKFSRIHAFKDPWKFFTLIIFVVLTVLTVVSQLWILKTSVQEKGGAFTLRTGQGDRPAEIEGETLSGFTLRQETPSVITLARSGRDFFSIDSSVSGQIVLSSQSLTFGEPALDEDGKLKIPYGTSTGGDPARRSGTGSLQIEQKVFGTLFQSSAGKRLEVECLSPGSLRIYHAPKAYLNFSDSSVRFGLANYITFLTTGKYLDAIVNSLLIALTATVVAGVLGTTLAYLYARYKMPMTSAVISLVTMASVSPPFLGAYAWRMLLGSSGIITRFLGINWTIMGMHGVIWVIIWLIFPVVFLLSYDSFVSIDNSMRECSYSLGADRRRTLFRIELPLAIPGIVTGLYMAMMTAFTDFGTPYIISLDLNTLPVLIYKEFMSEVGGNYSIASTGSVVMVLLSSMILMAQRIYLAKRSYASIKTQQPSARMPSAGKKVAIEILTFVLIAMAFVPHVTVLVTSFFKWEAGILSSRLTWENFSRLFNLNLNSIWVTLSTGTAATFLTFSLGIGIAYVIVKKRYPFFGQALNLLVMIPYIIPGTVLAIGFILLFNKPPILLTGTWLILVLAYFVRKLPYAVKSAESALYRIHPALEEAARSLGATPTKSFWDVTFPLMIGGVISGATLSFLQIMTEISSTIMLYRPPWKPMTAVIFENTIDAGADFGVASAMTVVLMVMLYVPLYFITTKTRKPKETRIEEL